MAKLVKRKFSLSRPALAMVLLALAGLVAVFSAQAYRDLPVKPEVFVPVNADIARVKVWLKDARGQETKQRQIIASGTYEQGKSYRADIYYQVETNNPQAVYCKPSATRGTQDYSGRGEWANFHNFSGKRNYTWLYVYDREIDSFGGANVTYGFTYTCYAKDPTTGAASAVPLGTDTAFIEVCKRAALGPDNC